MKKIVSLAFVLILLPTVLSLSALGLLGLQIAHASPYTDIEAVTAYDMITNGSYPNLVVLDVRRQDEYDGGHIYGAVWIPVTELEARIGELASHKDHEIIVYCRSGVRSVTASEILDSHNFTKVYNMQGGILAWESAGYPVWIATVHNVNTTLNYDTIQAAIGAPQTLDGHTILVDAGIYHEHVVVNKSVSLVGENRSTAVIDGNGTGNVIDITVHQVNVTGFTIRNGTNGIFINASDYNLISENIVTDNQNGIHLLSTCTCSPAHGNNIRNNIIKNNGFGIYLGMSTDNIIYHNNFINNTEHAYNLSAANVWDNGYPSGGNYWSDYTGIDSHSGLYQNQTGSDGIGDVAYIIGGNNQDTYPLVDPISFFNAGTWDEVTYYVHIVSNSTVSDFNLNPDNYMIVFNVTGSDDSPGFCRVTIPNELMWCDSPTEWNVTINGNSPTYLKVVEDADYTYIYFAYNHSIQEVQIKGIYVIPEFPTWTSILLMLIVLTVAVAVCRRRLLKTPIH